MLAAFLFAQALIGPEILSGTLPPRYVFNVAAPAIALARDERSLVIAWTANNEAGISRLYVARLDTAGQLSGAVREMPTSSTTERVDVAAPSIAKSVNRPGFLLAWLEVGSVTTDVFCSLDADLNPAVPRTLGAASFGGRQSAAIARSGKSDWLTANAEVFRLNADQSMDPFPSGVFGSDMSAATDFPVIVGLQETQFPVYTPCAELWFPYPCVRITYSTQYALQVVWLFAASNAVRFSFDTDAEPAIQSDGTDLLIAWFNGDQKTGGLVTATHLKPDDVRNFGPSVIHQMLLGSFGPDFTATRPDIATDGEHYVVVWRTRTAAGDYDVIGAAIDRNDTVTPLSIATSTADERDPSVIAIGAGRFLVAYEKIGDGGRRLAGRFLDFGNRRHAVR